MLKPDVVGEAFAATQLFTEQLPTFAPGSKCATPENVSYVGIVGLVEQLKLARIDGHRKR